MIFLKKFFAAVVLSLTLVTGVAGTVLPFESAFVESHLSANPASAGRQELSSAERRAVDNRSKGRPYDRKAYNSARKKMVHNEKHGGGRNFQKRQSHYGGDGRSFDGRSSGNY